MFKKSAEMSSHPSPVAYCIYMRVLRGETHGHYYLTRHRVRIKIKCRVQAVERQQPAALCFCSKDMRLKVREQVLHWYFFTSAWVCRCARRLERSAKARLQCGQENGRSPVCVRMCPLNSQGRENAFPQVGQTHGSVCERMCIFKAPRLLYSLGQCLQKKAGRVAGTVASLLSSLWPALFLLLRLGLLVCWGW